MNNYHPYNRFGHVSIWIAARASSWAMSGLPKGERRWSGRAIFSGLARQT